MNLIIWHMSARLDYDETGSMAVVMLLVPGDFCFLQIDLGHNDNEHKILEDVM